MDKVLTIVWLRLRLLRNGLRRGEGISNLISTIMMAFFWGILSLGMAVLFAAMVWQGEHPLDPAFLLTLYTILFFISTFCGMILPFLFGAGRVKLDISRFKMFPVSYRRLFSISLIACAGSFEHLLYYPTFIVVCLLGIILPGANVLLGFCFILSLWIFNLVWSHTLSLGIELFMKKRKGKEILGLVSVAIFILIAIGPAVFESLWGENWAKDVPVFQALKHNVVQVGKTLAPALAAKGLLNLRMGAVDSALLRLLLLWIWIIPGAVLGYFVFERYFVGDGGKISKRAGRQKAAQSRKEESGWSIADVVPSFLPPEVLAAAVKEWKYLLRSMAGRLNLVLVPLLAVIGVFLFARRPESSVLGMDAEIVAFYGILFFISQIVNNFMYNTFAWEGGGMQSYFISPASLQQVILGKNIGLWFYYVVLFLMVIAVWTVIQGPVEIITLVSGIIFIAAVILPFTSIGNFLSILFPVPKDISARDKSVSQTATLLSVASLAVIALVTGVFLFVPVLLGAPALQPLFLSVLLAIQLGVYLWAVRFAARLLMNRREKIVAALDSKTLGFSGS